MEWFLTVIRGQTEEMERTDGQAYAIDRYS
jgi:hypothetical protein